MVKRFIVKSFDVISGFIQADGQSYWVSQIVNGDIFASIRRSEAKVFGEEDLEHWENKEGFEVVLLPDVPSILAEQLPLGEETDG